MLKPARKRARVLREQWRPVGILKIADPIRHTEVAHIDDGRNLEGFQLGEGFVREGPVVLSRCGMRGVIRRTVAQVVDAELLRDGEVFAPSRVVPAPLHFVDPLPRPVRQRNRGIAVLDSRREHERLHDEVRVSGGALDAVAQRREF
jgi:hypothetical protein